MTAITGNRRFVHWRDEERCLLCGDTHDLDAHHLADRRQDGSDSPFNLALLCGPCHREADRGHIAPSTLLDAVTRQMAQARVRTNLLADKDAAWLARANARSGYREAWIVTYWLRYSPDAAQYRADGWPLTRDERIALLEDLTRRVRASPPRQVGLSR